MGEHQLTMSGLTVAVQVGDHIEIILAEQGSTGYLWEVVDSPEGLELIASDLTTAGGTAPGATAQRRFTFEVRAAVAGTLRLDRRRPWEPDRVPAESFEARLVPV